MRPALAEIQRAVCEQFELSRSELFSPTHARRIARPRQIFMFLAREMTVRSLPEIGNSIGGKDHATIIHGIRAIEGLLVADGDMAQHVSAIRHRVFAIVNDRIKLHRAA